MVFDKHCPWKSHLFDSEEHHSTRMMTNMYVTCSKSIPTAEAPINVKYVLYTDDKGSWRVQCVSETESSFANRLSLPEPWRGIRDDAVCVLNSCFALLTG